MKRFTKFVLGLSGVLGGFLAASAFAADGSFAFRPVEPSPTTSTLRAAALTPDGGFVVVGTNATVLRSLLATGADAGLQFVSESLPEGANPDLYTVVGWDEGSGALVGGTGAGLFSSEGSGQGWMSVESGFTGGVTIRGLSRGSASNFVAAARTVGLRSSTDGLTWSPSFYVGGGGLGERYNASAGGEAGLFGAAGVDGVIRWSVDGGATWNRLPGSRPSAEYFGIAAKGREFVAVGAGGLITRFAINEGGGVAGLIDQNLEGIGTLNAVSGTDTGWVAVGNGGQILVSETGEQWTPMESGSAKDLLGVAYAPNGSGALGGIMLVVGSDGTLLAGVASPPALSVTVDQPSVCYSGLSEGNPLLTAAGFDAATTAVDWFSGDTRVATNSPTYRPQVTEPGAYVYSAQARDLRAGVTGPASEPITITIHPLPEIPVVADAMRTNGVCNAATVEFTASNPPEGGRVEWLGDGGAVLATGPTFRPADHGATAAGNYTYAVRSVSAQECMSAQNATVALILTSLPETPVVADAMRTNGVCNAATVEFTVSNPPEGGRVEWLGDGGAVLATGPTFRPADHGATAAGNYTYAVRSVSAQECMSAENATVALILTPLPEIPVVADAMRTNGVCNAATVEFTASNPPEGGRVEWLGDGGAVLATGPTFRPADHGATVAGTYTYGVRSVSAQECMSAENATVALILTPLPEIPVVADAMQTNGVCNAATVEFTVSNPPEGGRVEWLGDGGAVLATGPTFRPADHGATAAGTYTYGVRSVSAQECMSAENAAVELVLTPCGPRLEILLVEIEGGGIAAELSWAEDGYLLERALGVTGPWESLPEAVSPYRDAIGEGSLAYFYRLRQR